MDDFSFLWDIYLTSVSHLCFQKTYNQQNWVGSTSRGADSHLNNPPDNGSVITPRAREFKKRYNCFYTRVMVTKSTQQSQ